MTEQRTANKLTYTTQEICQLLGVSRLKLYEMINKKMIRPLAVQKKPYLFPKSEVERVLQDMVAPNYYVEE